jgi:hypothetical protein
MIFLVEFSRRAGLRSVTDFPDDSLAQANAARAEALERNIENLDDVEIALFQTADIDTLKKTHARYFKSAAEMNQDIVEQLRKTLPL